MNLGQLFHTRGRIEDARDLLSPIYAKFTEGFDTIDLQDAKSLLHKWTFKKRKVSSAVGAHRKRKS
jgi:predicted ATPase